MIAEGGYMGMCFLHYYLRRQAHGGIYREKSVGLGRDGTVGWVDVVDGRELVLFSDARRC